jgi:hypothetical protein
MCQQVRTAMQTSYTAFFTIKVSSGCYSEQPSCIKLSVVSIRTSGHVPGDIQSQIYLFPAIIWYIFLPKLSFSSFSCLFSRSCLLKYLTGLSFDT